MNKTKPIRDRPEGSVLIVALCLLFIIVGLVLTILDVASDHRTIAVRQTSLDQAMYIAEAGVEVGARFMESNLIVIVSSTANSTNGSGSVGTGSYNWYITRSNTTTYCIISTGTVNGVANGSGVSSSLWRVVSLLDVYQPTYAEFALWSSNNAAINFGGGDTFYGHVHSNTELYFDGASNFYAPLTSEYGTYSGSLSSVYLQDGMQLNTIEGSLGDVNFNNGSGSLKSLTTAGGTLDLVLSGNTTLTFNGGTVSITNPTQGWTNHSYSIPSAGGMIYVANNGTISGSKAGVIYLEGGTVTGPLTVISENEMYVENSITYTHNPANFPTTTDALGLISQDDIWVDSHAPAALTIDAAMIAAGTSPAPDNSPGSFGVIGYDSKTPTGTLTVYGGIVQQNRGAVGTLDWSGDIATGYVKNYSYDIRFLKTPPPNYPVIGGQINFSQWQESGN
jgi:Tfp pilus assembly protein PilX